MGKKRAGRNTAKPAVATIPPPVRPVRKSFTNRFPIVFVLAVTFLTFQPSLSNDFVNWDDDINVYENRNLAALDAAHVKAIFSSTVIGGYNPLTILTFAIEKHFFGLNPRVFHFNNLLLHLICVALVFYFLLKLKVSVWGAALGALLFGIHPMRVESVAWITERKDLLFGAFYLAALLAYVGFLQANYAKAFFWLALVFFVGALFSKIQAVALPLSLLALDYYFRRPLRLNLVLEKIPFFALSLLVGGLGVRLLSKSETWKDETGFGLFDRLLIGAHSFCVYLGKLFVPHPLAAAYAYPERLTSSYYLAPLGILALAYGGYRAFQRKDYAFVFGVAFFTVNIIFVLQILGAGSGFLADRFSYIPYLGLFFLGARLYDSFEAKPSTRVYARMASAAYLALFAVVTWNQCSVWKNGETLWTHVIQCNAESGLPYRQRAFYYRTKKEFQKALADYEMALKHSKDKSSLHNGRGRIYFDLGQTDRAISEYDAALKIDPKYAEALVNRGAAYGKLGQYDRALADLNKGIEIDPAPPNGYFNRSLLHTVMNRFDLALGDYDAYLDRNPTNASMWNDRGLAKGRLGRHADAIADFTEAIRLDPNQGVFYLDRSRAYHSLGKNAEALRDAQIAKTRGAPVDAAYLQSLQFARP